MARYNGPNFILEKKLYLQKWQESKLEHLFDCSERMYNETVYYANGCINKLRKDADYITTLELYNNEKDEDTKKQYGKTLATLREKYGLTKSGLQKFINDLRNESYMGTIESDVAQKLADRVWKAVEKCLFSNGKKIHFKKFRTLDSIEGKKNITAIRFNKNANVVVYQKMVIPVKIRDNDYYAKEALENEISYCRIVRKPFKNGYEYFVQIVLRGIPPLKPNRMPNFNGGNTAFDMGTSVVNAIGQEDGLMEPLAPKTVKECNKAIILLSKQLDRIRRLNNPNNYKEDGTCKKGHHKWVKTKNYYKTLFALKNMYRLKSIYIREHQARLQNKILSYGGNFATEDINFTSWMRRSKKPTEQTDKEIEVTNKKGEKKKVKKCKKKKRFGKTLNNNSPGKFVRDFAKKLEYFGLELEMINTKEFKASQINHDTGEYEKIPLSQRTKIVVGHKVQRDLYSAFAMANRKDLETIDRQKCIDNFEKFLEIQERIINNLKARGDDLPACMGIK